MNKYKRIIKMMLLIIAIISLFVINVNADDTDEVLSRRCRYVNTDGDIVYVTMTLTDADSGSILDTNVPVEDANGNTLSNSATFSINGKGVTNSKYIDENGYSCPTYLGNINNKYILSEQNDSFEDSYYTFNGVISNYNDVYNAGAYYESETGVSDLTESELNSKQLEQITCNYNVDGTNISIYIGTNGSITTSLGESKAIIENPVTLLKTIETELHCPATICYKDNWAWTIWDPDRIYLSADDHYSCPDGYTSNDDKNKADVESITIPVFLTSEERTEGQSLLNKIKANEKDTVLTCYNDEVDINKTCSILFSAYQESCRDEVGSEECTTAITTYESCIEGNYTTTYKSTCQVVINAFEKAIENLPEKYKADLIISKEISIMYPSFKNPYNASYISCEDLLGTELIEFLSAIYFYLEVGAVVLVIVLGILDFVKATASDEADANKKAFKSFTRRIIVLILVILLPFILEFLLSVFEIGGIDATNPLCNIIEL